MDRINGIWQQIENQQSEGSGLLKVRYSTEITAELFLGLLTNERLRCFLLRLNAHKIKSFPAIKNLRGLKMEIFSDALQPNYAYLNLVLLNPESNEIFDILIQDIINKVSNLNNENQIMQVFNERIDTWRMLFEKTIDKALSTEAQQGLYGELYFLRKWIKWNGENIGHCIDAWLGTDNALRDFQIGKWAIEVKTTKGNNHQKILVSSERQLDSSKLDKLWLFNLSVEIQQQNGETLNQLVDCLIDLMKTNFLALTEFRTKLIQGGYLMSHRSFYENYGYQVRGQTFYIVKDNFPRIEESMVPQGTGDVKYSIILSYCSAYIINESSVFEIIT